MLNIASYQSIRKTFITQPHLKLPSEVLTELLKDNARALEVMDALAVKVDRNHTDRFLNDAGMQKADTAAANEHVQYFAFLGGRRTNTADRIATLRATVYGPLALSKSETDIHALIRETRALWLLQAYQSIDNWDSAYTTAIGAGDLELARALAYAPGKSRISEAGRQRGNELYGQNTTPKEFEQLQHALLLQAEQDAIAEQTRLVLTGLGGDPELIAKHLKVHA